MKVVYKTTSEQGMTPGGNLPPEKLLEWINAKIIDANMRIENSGQNGGSNSRAEGQRYVLRELKAELFGNVYDA